MNIRKSLRPSLLTCVAFAALLAGCESREEQAREAFEQYQAASASGDLAASRKALQDLVAADDTKAEYWIELGKLHLQTPDLGAAYDAFTRAHELDRGNAQVVEILTQLALRTGNLELAEDTARELELLAPGSPTVGLTYGYVALRRGDFDEADRQAGLLLAAAPYDSSGKVLRARVLIGTDRADEAIALLREQVKLQPADESSLRTLQSLFELREEWADSGWAAQALLNWQPKDGGVRSKLIEAQIRTGRVPDAVSTTLAGLTEAEPVLIERLLSPWVALRSEQKVADGVFRLARESNGDRRIAFARFLVRAGRWQQAADLTRDSATLPVTAANSSANALFATAMAGLGQRDLGLFRLDQVIALDAANADGLAGRSALRLEMGRHKGAVEDAERLLAVDRDDPAPWLLLARIHTAAGRLQMARRTLWDAFHEMPSNQAVYDALKAVVTRMEGPQAGLRLAEEYRDQRSQELTRSFV